MAYYNNLDNSEQIKNLRDQYTEDRYLIAKDKLDLITQETNNLNWKMENLYHDKADLSMQNQALRDNLVGLEENLSEKAHQLENINNFTSLQQQKLLDEQKKNDQMHTKIEKQSIKNNQLAEEIKKQQIERVRALEELTCQDQEMQMIGDRHVREVRNFHQLLDDKNDLLRNAEVQNCELKDELTRLQVQFDRQRDYYEPELELRIKELHDLQNLIADMKLELRHMTRPTIIGQHDIEKTLRLKIRDLEEELYKAKRDRRKQNLEDTVKYKRDFSEEDRLKRELKDLQGRLQDLLLRKEKLEHLNDEKDDEIQRLKYKIRDLEKGKIKRDQVHKAGEGEEDLSGLDWNAISPEARKLLDEYDQKYGFQKKYSYRPIFNLLVQFERMFNRIRNLDKFANKIATKKTIVASQSLSMALIDLLAFIRILICDIIFEMFVRSANHAYHRKINSLILFIINIKELKDRSLRGLLVVLKIYLRVKHMAETFVPDYARKQERFYENQLRILSDAKPKLRGDTKSEITKWILGTIGYINKRKNYDKNDRNKEYLYLFRLLAIKYRVKYPLSGKEYNVDNDLRTYLEDKICSSFLRIMESAH